MARERILQVRLTAEEQAQIEAKSGPRKLSEYMRSASLRGIAPDVAADFRSLLRIAAKGGTVGEAAAKDALQRLADLCGAEEAS